MTQQTRVNIKAKVNSASIRRERRNGRDVIIVPSATLPDNVVMNGVRYPAEEIARSYASLNRTPAPLGHPTVEGAFVSAKDPEGLARGWVGAWNENVRRENGRVYLDKVIDVEQASQLNGGKAVLAAIDKGEPIHTSTGLYAVFEPVTNATDGAQYTARDIVFDHDAILIGEEGAATPAQGVGMMVNKAVAPDGAQVSVVNSSMTDDADRQIDWAVMDLARAVERRKQAGAMERFKTAIMEALGLAEREPQTEEKEKAMAVSEEQFKALSDEVKALSDGMKTVVANAIADAVKPLIDAQAALAANAKAAEDAELADLRAKIVKANLLDEAAAGELTINAARALAKAATPGKAAALNGAFVPASAAADVFTLPKET
jgi:hypothetical protein